MHFGVDSAVAFLALFVVVVVIFGVDASVVVVVALVLGAAAAPFTRRAEARALAARAGTASPPGEPPTAPEAR